MNTPTPGLTPPATGLRTVRYDARSAAKVSLVVQPGDTLIVSDDVADQLAAASAQFKDDAPADAPVASSSPAADEPAAEQIAAEAAEQSEQPAAPPPAKRPRKRAAAKPKE